MDSHQKWTLLHDCENCAIPGTLNGISLFTALSTFLFRAFPTSDDLTPSLEWLLFTSNGFSGLGSASTVIELQMKGCLVICAGTKKGAVDVAIKAQCSAFRRRNGDLPAELRRRRPVAIISGDRDFAHEVNDLRGDGFPVVIVHGEAVNPGFRQIVESPQMAIRWEEVKALAAGGGSLKRRRVRDGDSDKDDDEEERQLQEALRASLKESTPRKKLPPPPPPPPEDDGDGLAFFAEGDVTKLEELGFPRERAIPALTQCGSLNEAAIALSLGQF
jgi:hypothetical protein